MRASGDRQNDRRRRASSDDEPPPFGRTSLATTGRQQGQQPPPPQQQHPEGHMDPEHPYKHSTSAPNSSAAAEPAGFDPVLPRSLSLSSSLASSHPPPPARQQRPPETARRSTAASYATAATAAAQERRSAFHRTFSEAPEPLPTPFKGLVNFLLVQTGFRAPLPPRPGRGRGEWRQPKTNGSQSKKDEANEARWEAATAAAAAAAAAVEEGRLGDEEEGGGHARDATGAGAGDGDGVARVEFGDLKGLRARYVSNALLGDAGQTHKGQNNKGGVHDLVKHKWESIIDDPWIEEIRAQDFLMKLAVSLQRYGSPVQRTEAILAALAGKLRVEGQFYLLPNLLLCAFGIDAASETHMLKCPQDFDAFRYRKTSHLVSLLLAADTLREDLDGDGVVDDEASAASVATKEREEEARRPRIRSLPEAVAKLDSIINSPPIYSKAIIFLCYLISGAAASLVFWRGDWHDAVVATIATFFVALVIVPGSNHFFVAKVQVLLSSILTGVVSTAGSMFLESPCAKAIYYAPTSFMFTGWSLTFSLMEFSTGAALLGTVRLGNALVTGLLIGYGIQIGHDIVYTFMSHEEQTRLKDWATNDNCQMQPWYVQLGLFPLIGIPYAIMMHAAPVQWPAMVLSAGAAVALMNGPLSAIQEHLSVFLVALLIGGFGNVYARLSGSPALIIIVNATYMIVPGSMAVTSSKALFDQNLQQGWGTAVSMLLIAISIAAGLLVAQGVALCVSMYGGKLVCGEARRRRRRRPSGADEGPVQGGIDSVYF